MKRTTTKRHICKCKGKCKCKGNRKSKRGGTSCGAQGCPIAPYPTNRGGSKRQRQLRLRRKTQRIQKRGGRSFYQPAPALPPFFVGKPWTWDLWLGQGPSTINHSNHFPLNKYHVDPQLDGPNRLFGGTKGTKRTKGTKNARKNTKRRKQGGSTFFQNAVNGYRDVAYNFDSAYSALRGNNMPVNPLPYKDQLVPRLGN